MQGVWVSGRLLPAGLRRCGVRVDLGRWIGIAVRRDRPARRDLTAGAAHLFNNVCAKVLARQPGGPCRAKQKGRVTPPFVSFPMVSSLAPTGLHALDRG